MWHSAAPEHKTPPDDKADKKETIQFTLGAEIHKSDSNAIYNGDEVMSRKHAVMIDGKEKVVFCGGLLIDGGKKVKQWRHLTRNYPGA